MCWICLFLEIYFQLQLIRAVHRGLCLFLQTHYVLRKGSLGLFRLVGLSYRKYKLEIEGREQMGSGIYFSCFLLLSVLSSLLLPRTRLVAEASGRPVQSAVQLWVMGQLPPPAFQPVDDNGPSAHLLIPVAHSFVWCPYLLPRASQYPLY